jgi:hypothetical protein
MNTRERKKVCKKIKNQLVLLPVANKAGQPKKQN